MQLLQELAFRRTSPMTEPRNVALVVGAQGVIGRNLVQHLETLDGWEVFGLSRRGGQLTGRVRHVPVDLLDPADTAAKLRGPTELTHVFYVAYKNRPPWAGV